MEETKKSLVNKISWTEKAEDRFESDEKSNMFFRCQKLESEGFGLLASDIDPSLIDPSESVVCPDGDVFSPKQIANYWERRGGKYSSKNLDDVKMHKARVYYFTFKE